MSSNCNCIINLLDEAANSLKENTNINDFIKTFTDYSLRSLHAESAAFFHYNNKNKTIKAIAVSGTFPTLIKAPNNVIAVISSSPEKIKDYLLHKEFILNQTPFGVAITEQHVVLFSEEDLRKRLSAKIVDCSSMMIIPVITEKIFGVLVLANKENQKRFTKEDVQLAIGMAETAGITISQLLSIKEIQEKRKIDQQLKTAAIIQKHLLPQTVPKTDKFEFATYYKPAFHIGGDYFDFINVDAQHIGIVIADVSGKGYAAGLVMATARSLFSVIALGNLSPSDVLAQLNKYLVKLIPVEMFISITYAILNTATGELIWTRAGHEPIICSSAGKKVKILDGGSGMVVGMLEGNAFKQTLSDEHYNIEPGDSILFYTDGVTEANDEEQNEFGIENLIRAMRSATKMSAEQAVNLITHKLNRFVNEQQPYDDISLVLIRYIDK